MNHYNYIPNRDTSDHKPAPASAFPPSSSPNIWYCSKCGQFFRNPGRTKNLSCGACGFSLDETSMSEKDYDAKTTEEKEQWKKEYAAYHLPKASVKGPDDDYEVSYHPNRWADIISFTGWFVLAVVAMGVIAMLFSFQILPAIGIGLGGLLLVSGFMMVADMAQDIRLIRHYMDKQNSKQS